MSSKDETIVIDTKKMRKRDVSFMEDKKRFPMTVHESKKKYNRKKVNKGEFKNDTL